MLDSVGSVSMLASLAGIGLTLLATKYARRAVREARQRRKTGRGTKCNQNDISRNRKTSQSDKYIKSDMVTKILAPAFYVTQTLKYILKHSKRYVYISGRSLSKSGLYVSNMSGLTGFLYWSSKLARGYEDSWTNGNKFNQMSWNPYRHLQSLQRIPFKRMSRAMSFRTKQLAKVFYYGGGHISKVYRFMWWPRMGWSTSNSEERDWNDEYSRVLRKYNRRLSLYRKIPLKSMSRLWGRFNQLELPVWLRSPAFRLYIWMFSCRLDDAAVQDLKYYRNLSEFFRRQLRPEVRPIDKDHVLASPADGRVLHLGRVTNGALEQVKGVTYSLQGFLGTLPGRLTPIFHYAGLHTIGKVNKRRKSKTPCSDDEILRKMLVTRHDNDLFYCTIYLAPGDYHRFHSPTEWTVFARRHFPGELFSVNPGIARWLQGVFNFNERAVYFGRWCHGFFSMTAVGATNVGSISVFKDQGLVTNSTRRSDKAHHDVHFTTDQQDGFHVCKGELFGEFNLGSTIVLIFEAPKEFNFSVHPGQKLKFGQAVGGYVAPALKNEVL